MPQKGLSVDEKRKRLEELFHETQEFYQLKELEKIAPKKKGITAQTVKEILQSLVDDNLVTMDKIGTSNYYWSFPSAAIQIRKNKTEEMMAELTNLQKTQIQYEEQITSAHTGREDSNEREELLQQLKEAEARKARNLAELGKYSDCDPEVMEAKKKAAKIAKEAANRWTDNIFTLQTHCAREFNIESSAFNQQFNIPDDFDNIS